MPRFDQQQILVTGGTSGIGEAIARGFATAGATVVATGVTTGEVQAATAQWSAAGLKTITARQLDVTDEASIAALVSEFARLDGLVQCAGIIVRGGGEFTVENFERVLDINLTGAMRVATACRPLLAERGGAIVNLASMLSFFGSGFVPAYSASKGGISQLTKSLAIAWAPQNIRVNAIAPGWIVTPLTQPLVDDVGRRQAIIDRTPLGRWGEPEDVVGAVQFLCSPAARFITGVVLPVDGGYSIV
ncbi:MAG: SDR family oxidoreductase [Planctomycetaceae bacterium]|nr:SDR family oxidoreductase [Planctomycetaceae bacterium]